MAKKINTKQAIPYGIGVVLGFFSLILQFFHFSIIYVNINGEFMPYFSMGFPINFYNLTYMFESGFHPEYLCFFISSVLYFFVPLTLMLVIAGKYLIDNFKPEYSEKFNYLLALPFALFFADRLISFCGNVIMVLPLFSMSINIPTIINTILILITDLLLVVTPALVLLAILFGFKKPKFNFIVFISPIIALVIFILSDVLTTIGAVLVGSHINIGNTKFLAQFLLFVSIACVYATPVLKAIKERKAVTE